MFYFKNIELAEKYHISLGTVRNWIEATQEGKLDLALYSKDDKIYVANTAVNISIIEQLVEKRKKYRNTIAAKVVAPSAEFYKLYNQEQVYDIVKNLEIHHEIPRQYNYFDDGADSWDKYTQRMAKEDAPNLLTAGLELLVNNQGYIDALLARYKCINVIDIGVGNAYPAKALLEHLLERGRLGRYAGIDISPQMLKIAENNVNKWFGDTVSFEGFDLDITWERFTDILAGEYIKKEAKDTANLILFLGGTLCNLRGPEGALRVIHDSMDLNDYLIHTQKLDTDTSRRYFDFHIEPGSVSLAPNHRLIFDLFNIDDSYYEVEMGFDSEKYERYIRVRLKVALTIKFHFDEGERLIDLDKGDTILLWRYLQQDPLAVLHLFDRNDFNTIQTSLTEDQQYLLAISKIKQDK